MNIYTKIQQIIIAGYPMALLYIINIILDIGFNIYKTIPWFDSPMHLVGGAAAAWSVHRYYDKFTKISIKTSSQYMDWFLLVATVAVISLGWEIYELLMSSHWPSIVQVTVSDTLKDMTLGLLGALVYAIKTDVSLKRIKKRR